MSKKMNKMVNNLHTFIFMNHMYQTATFHGKLQHSSHIHFKVMVCHKSWKCGLGAENGTYFGIHTKTMTEIALYKLSFVVS